MAGLKQLIQEVHRRSLWQVLLIYIGAAYTIREATDLSYTELVKLRIHGRRSLSGPHGRSPLSTVAPHS